MESVVEQHSLSSVLSSSNPPQDHSCPEISLDTPEPENLCLAWETIAQCVCEHDAAEVYLKKEEIDILLVFSGLLSIVITILFAVSPKALKIYPDDRRISEQFGNSTITNSTLSPLSNDIPLKATFPIIAASIMWTTSLIISLATASWGLFIRAWIDELMQCTEHFPRQRVISRSHSHAVMTIRGVFSFAVTARYWLCIAASLFLLGLEMFMFAQNMIIGLVTAAGVLLWRGYLLFKGIFLKYRMPSEIRLLNEEIHNNANLDLVTLLYTRYTLPLGEIDQAILEVIKNRSCNDLSSMASSNLIAILPKSSVHDMLLLMVRAISSSRAASLGIGMENSGVFRNMYLNFGSTLRAVVRSSLNADEDQMMPEYLVPELLDLIHNDPITAGFAILAMCSVASYILTHYLNRWDSLFKLKKWSTADDEQSSSQFLPHLITATETIMAHFFDSDTPSQQGDLRDCVLAVRETVDQEEGLGWQSRPRPFDLRLRRTLSMRISQSNSRARRTDQENSRRNGSCLVM